MPDTFGLFTQLTEMDHSITGHLGPFLSFCCLGDSIKLVRTLEFMDLPVVLSIKQANLFCFMFLAKRFKDWGLVAISSPLLSFLVIWWEIMANCACELGDVKPEPHSRFTPRVRV